MTVYQFLETFLEGFPNSTERRRKWKFYFGEFRPFNALVMLKITFNKHPLIKTSMTYVYIKTEVKKNDTTTMTTAINEACI